MINDIDENEKQRYARQIILQEFGMEAQKKIKRAKVLITGVGGLGSPVSYYLAACGVGIIGICDYDTVDVSNLNRQILHNTNDIGRHKTISAENKLKVLNPHIKINKHNERLNINNIEKIIKRYDVVIDCCDNFISRYLISDCCYFLKKPVIEGAVSEFEGILMTIIPDETPCYRCLYKNPPEDVMKSSVTKGILGAVAGIVGSIQALEAIKVITGIGKTVSGKILTFNALETNFREIKWKRRDDCPLCGKNPTISRLMDSNY